LDKTAIRMSRGLAKAGGFYAGAVIAAVPVSTFEAIFGEEVLDSTDSVSLVGKDGRPRVHYGTGPALPEIIDNHTLEEAVGARWVAATAADPQPYYLAWKHVSDSPLLVVVSRSEAGILRPFLEKRALYLRAGAVTTALLVLFGFVAAWLSARLAVRYRQELATRVAYRAASEGALDGFFILDALRDPNGVVRAFRVADCNQRAAELMGLTRGDMLERELSQIMSPSMAAKVTASYARIVATGQGTRLREFIPESDSPLKAAWVAHQAVPTENGIAVTFRDISAAKTHDRELEDQARVDTLTGLPNRRWLTENLPAAISACAAKQASAALLFIDLDNFKTANDTLGHALGDQLLQAVAKRVRAAIRDVDVLCRLGGDEFTVILGIVETAQEAAAVSERILTALRQPFSIAGHETMVGSSIGISLYPANGLDADTLIKHADLAMYRAKELGKGGFQFFAPHLSAHVEKKLALENDLRLAIERNEFVLAYQPKMAASAGRVIGLEALIRWNSPTRGRVPPGDFIAVAEKTGLICPIGVIVLETACRQLAAWRAQGFALLPVSINVSPCQFNRTDVVADIQAALERYDLPGALLEVEVTESAIMEQPEMAREKLLPLRALGVRIAIDDFGTGYSSLAHLKSLDVDVLKIDRSFIADITNTAGARALVGAVITLAAALGIEVIAEGVETSGQLDFLTSVGCDRIQGFLFSKPVEAGDVHAVIQSLQQPPAETRLVA
jgi:diguanylate cyclase (GGDEF)-like protein